MTDHVVVVGAGYAGAGTVKSFAAAITPGEVELTWINETDHHLVLHEVHRVIRNPDVAADITVPCEAITPRWARFREDRVTGVDTDERVVELEDGDPVDYDYLLVALGSATAFYGIEGLREHSHTLKNLDDAHAIREAVVDAAEAAEEADPARVVVGGAGLSGIQAAGEVAELRDERDLPIDVTLVEGLDQVLPGRDPELQGALRRRLLEADIEVLTGDFIVEVDETAAYLGGAEDDAEELPYDVLVWTGGITGQAELADADVTVDERSDRVLADADFRTTDERVFCIGDSALIDQGDDGVAPPTAQAAWQAAEVAGENLAAAVRGRPLESWRYQDRGTLVSVGEKAVAHDIDGIPIRTFGGPAARVLKKAVAARWLATVASLRRAWTAWKHL